MSLKSKIAPLSRTPLKQSLVLAICALAGLVAAVLSVTTVSLSPPGIRPLDLRVAVATTHAQIDLPYRNIVDEGVDTEQLKSLTTRATLLARMMTSAPVLDAIGRRAGIPGSAIAGETPVVADVPAAMTEPDSERRANQILNAGARYRLNVQPNRTLPVLDIYAQAPTAAEAARLAEGAITGLRDHLRQEAIAQHFDPVRQVRIEALGPARASLIGRIAAPETALLAFVTVFGLLAGLALLVARIRHGWAFAAEQEAADPTAAAAADVAAAAVYMRAPDVRAAPAAGTLAPAVALDGRGAGLAGPITLPSLTPALQRTRRRIAAHLGGDWPRTTRVLPWLIAAFIAMLWVVPFNSIALSASLPLDLKLDRIVLPVVVGVWALALAAGGVTAPRLRASWVHAGIGAFVLLACVSLLLNAHNLSHTLELERGVKRLTLLMAYAGFFVVVASSVRRTEIRAYLTFTLGLAVLAALGTVWEYRFAFNPFYDFADKALPGAFSVEAISSTGMDDIGRRLVRGPTEHPLETVTILTMALPIALVRLMDCARNRQRILYGLAACILLAAMLSTFRKSAFLAPIAVIATLGYFRRGQLLKLAPLALLLLVVAKILSPGALGGIAFQLNTNRLGVTTVSDRTSDYEAIRPDVWSHLAFGRGYGTYDHTIYRILDMELLGRLVEGGVLGVAAYLLMLGSIVAMARRAIRTRDPEVEQIGVVAAAAAVGFLTVSVLFDVMSFPHCAYILLCIGAFLAVALKSPDDPPEGRWSS